VVKDGDSWQVVDWKSNRLFNAQLGDDACGPDLQALRRNMRDHHYPLQYALYAVALRRLLRIRSLGAPQRLGAAHYAYVRYGSWVSADLDPGLIDALDKAMGGGDHG
jgi:ATP-dependent exoDNAse (exonuclease V) beta subunit